MQRMLKHKGVVAAALMSATLLDLLSRQVEIERAVAVIYLFWHFAFVLFAMALIVVAVWRPQWRKIVAVVFAITCTAQAWSTLGSDHLPVMCDMSLLSGT